MTNTDLIKTFYESFARGDAEAMVNCYSPNIIFTDPAFGELRGDDVKNMWRMLIERSKGNIKITFSNVSANDKTGSADWIAEYLFAQTKRKVINKITAAFEFENGKITRHTDYFNLWKWSQQAFGLPGYVLGWSAFIKNKIRKQTQTLLKEYTASRSQQ